MVNTVLTHLQIFGIGFSFGIAGPCLFICAPLIFTYMSGSNKTVFESIRDLSVFLFGRLLAYLVLGIFAGVSSAALHHFIGSPITDLFKPLAGFVSILLAIFMLFRSERAGSKCASSKSLTGFGGLFIIGFAIGLSPCAPLIALLFEITLISNHFLDGMFYAFSFGLGTFISSFLVIGLASLGLSRFSTFALRSSKAKVIVRVLSAILLIALGINLITGNPSSGSRQMPRIGQFE